MKCILLICSILFYFEGFGQAQAVPLRIIRSVDSLRATIKENRNKKLVGLKSSIPGLKLDLKYARTNNFVGRKMYDPAPSETFLRRPAAKALKKAAKILRDKGYHLLIWDAYRPYLVTVEFWKLVGDDRYVANPARGSGHNKGLSVDLTLVDVGSENSADMGTGFDNFTDSAHHNFQKLDSKVLERRRFLKNTMESCGFKALETEWWHYSWPDNQGYEVLDLPFETLEKLFD